MKYLTYKNRTCNLHSTRNSPNIVHIDFSISRHTDNSTSHRSIVSPFRPWKIRNSFAWYPIDLNQKNVIHFSLDHNISSSIQVFKHALIQRRATKCFQYDIMSEFDSHCLLATTLKWRVPSRGLRVEHFCYPTRTRNTGPLPVPVPDPYSKLLPNPTRTRGYTRTRTVPAT